MTTRGGTPVLTLLAALREALAAPATEGGGAGASALRASLLAELTGHLIGRLTHPDAPALVAVTGPTGTGRSTLVNGLAGAAVSPAGVLRPTTRHPILVHRSEDARWFPGDRRWVPAWKAVESVVAAGLPPGVALLDVPARRRAVHLPVTDPPVADPLLAVADAWLFVTSATRYADAIGWQTLQSAGGRSGDLAVVLNRVRPEAVPTVRSELIGLMAAHELAEATLLVVAETELTTAPHEPADEVPADRLPDNALVPVRAWLEQLATGRSSRDAVLHRSVAGCVAALAGPVSALERLESDPRLRRALQALERR